MAPKDYVKRPRAPAKKQAKRRPQKGQNAPLPWTKLFISIAVVAMFVFGLYKLQSMGVDEALPRTTNNELELDAKEVEGPANAVSSENLLEQAELPALPELGEEEWEYIDSLPELSVEVDATGPLQSDKEFIMQCGSFKTQDRAEELKATIAFQGLESRILTSDGRNGLWYRVVLGPYERKRNAERHRHQLRTANVNGCKIW